MGLYATLQGTKNPGAIAPGCAFIWKTEYKQDKNLFLQFVARVLNVDIDYEYVDYSINLGIDKLKEFFKSIGLPTSLSEIGIYEKDIRGIAEHAIYVNDGEPLGNFVKLSADDIENIYRLAL
ncbi:MAG: iron-containing alcohol dehydrogenase [Christensenellaceae bacterium]|nr:iron-containing alcohol dehydrogenase [Christensenellaceae bacterium]